MVVVIGDKELLYAQPRSETTYTQRKTWKRNKLLDSRSSIVKQGPSVLSHTSQFWQGET